MPKMTVVYDTPIQAPIQKGQKIGVLKIDTNGNTTHDIDLIAADTIEKVGYFGKIKHIVLSLFQ